MSIVEVILVGLVVGAIARLLVPGRDPIGILGTLAVGVGGSLLGWWLGRDVIGANVGAHPWLWSIGGAVLVLLLVRSVTYRRHGFWRSRRRWASGSGFWRW
jgi:uncharacterized membrane protein YeaQ/YmgE (transglycosylase-associated protein family)